VKDQPLSPAERQEAASVLLVRLEARLTDNGRCVVCGEFIAHKLTCDVLRLRRTVQVAEAQLTALTQERDALQVELRRIDSVMARRPALDQPTRWQNIEKAIDTARRAESAEAALRAAQGREQKVREFTLAIFNAIGSDISPREAGDALNREYPIKDRSVL
jgi:hypothetical protein